MTDITDHLDIVDHGTVSEFRPLTAKAKGVLEAGAGNGAVWIGGNLFVEHRFVDGVIDHFTERMFDGELGQIIGEDFSDDMGFGDGPAVP